MELICMKWTYRSSVQRQDTDHVWRILGDCPWKSPATQVLACILSLVLHCYLWPLDKNLPWGCSLESCHCLQISKLAKTLHMRVPMVCSIPRCRGFPSDSLVTRWLTGCNAGNLQERWVPFLGWEDPLEKEIATHSRILAWEIPWTEEPKSLQWSTSVT